jgi:hypothetical protein
MSFSFVNSGVFGAVDLTAGYTLVTTLAPPTSAGGASNYRLVMRLTGLGAGHELVVRTVQSAVIEEEVQPGNGQTVDEIEFGEILAYGEDAIIVQITDAAGVSDDASGTWYLYRETTAPGGSIVPVPPTGGEYYAKTAMILMHGGEESFNAEFRLDPQLVTADPDVVATVIQLADNTVEAIAYKVGLNKNATGPGAGWAVAPDDEPVYTECSLWASRWARAQAHAMQPENNNDPGDRDDVEGSPPDGQAGQPEAGFVGARREAERKIKEILKAKYERLKLAEAVPQLGDDIIAVGWNDRCGAIPASIDPNIVYRR